MAEHTPGPWRVGLYDQVLAEDGRVADCQVSGRTLDDVDANARLIAAAPELLEALEGLLQDMDDCGLTDCASFGVVEKAKSAISKANPPNQRDFLMPP